MWYYFEMSVCAFITDADEEDFGEYMTYSAFIDS